VATDPAARALARRFVDAMAPALRQAAALTRALEGRVPNRPKLAETSESKAALTAADTASQETILVRLLDAFPEVELEAEEDTPTTHAFPVSGSGRVVIDPVDGTLHSYLEARGPYAILVGLVWDERFIASLVALPRENLLFDAVLGDGATRRNERGEAGAASLSGPSRRVLVSHGVDPTVLSRLRARGYDAVPAAGGAVAVAPLVPGVCGGLRVAPANAGPAGVSSRGRVGLLVAREAGAIVCGMGGAPFPEEVDAVAPGLVTAASPAVRDDLLFALAAAFGA